MDNEDFHHPTQLPRLEIESELSRQWAVAAERAFSSALDRPDVYQRTTNLVGKLARLLGSEGRGIVDLRQAWDGRAALLSRVTASDPLLAIDGLDPETITGAAFSMRHRRAAEETAEDQRVARLRGHEQAKLWATIEEVGYAPGDPFVPYRRLEVHPQTGTALLITTEPNESLTGCLHTVQILAIDTATGQLRRVEAFTSINTPVVSQFPSVVDRETCVAQLRVAISSRVQ